MIASLFAAVLLSLFEWASPRLESREIAITAPTDYATTALTEAVEDWGFTVVEGEAQITIVGEKPPTGIADAGIYAWPCVIRIDPHFLTAEPQYWDLWHTVLTHEVGHCLGLGHAPNWLPSTMAENVLQPLSWVDRLAMNQLYH